MPPRSFLQTYYVYIQTNNNHRFTDRINIGNIYIYINSWASFRGTTILLLLLKSNRIYSNKLYFFFLPVIENIIGLFDREKTTDLDFECNIVSWFKINSQLSWNLQTVLHNIIYWYFIIPILIKKKNIYTYTCYKYIIVMAQSCASREYQPLCYTCSIIYEDRLFLDDLREFLYSCLM